jgi:hypothetical protein
VIQRNLPGDFFARVLADEQTRCLIMLDGLDEVATAERRTEALKWIEASAAVPGQQILVTSRFAGYRGETRLPPNYLELHIREFRDEDVRTFVRRWYRQVETRQRGDTDQWRGWARQQSDNLIQQLFSAENLTRVGSQSAVAAVVVPAAPHARRDAQAAGRTVRRMHQGAAAEMGRGQGAGGLSDRDRGPAGAAAVGAVVARGRRPHVRR